MNEEILVGLTGTLGAGKGTVAHYFTRKGFHYTSCSDYLRSELKKRGIEENVDTLKSLGDSLRREHGPGYLSEQLLKTISGNTVIDSLRNPGEISVLKGQGRFFLIAVDAPQQIRYERIQTRQRAGDNVSFEKFKEQEDKQLTGKKNETQLEVCLSLADYTINNISTVEHLYKQLDTCYKSILEKAAAAY